MFDWVLDTPLMLYSTFKDSSFQSSNIRKGLSNHQAFETNIYTKGLKNLKLIALFFVNLYSSKYLLDTFLLINVYSQEG